MGRRETEEGSTTELVQSKLPLIPALSMFKIVNP